ncbi:fibronectin type III domain-containing protein [Parapedobacter deserti]|uniref:Fibronectin type III domain-containing protein n=1 Tax=Parapedobacter deserti TaxID=1912957 RepID=A0ABV7JJI4_9SPHI
MHRISEQVATYRIYRKDTEAGEFDEKAWLETDMNEFVDTLSYEEQRWYAIRSVGVSGTLSALSPVVEVASRYHKPLPPGSVRLMVDEGGVTVNWDTDGESGKIRSYRIYRALASGGMEAIAEVESVGEQLSYVDKAAKAGNRYYYYVSSIDRRGVESEASEEVSITMP